MLRGNLQQKAILAAMTLLACPGLLCAQQSVMDLEGRQASPFADRSSKVVVLVFLRRDCPVSGRYAPSIQQLSRRYANGANFWLIYPDKSDTPKAIRKSVAD